MKLALLLFSEDVVKNRQAIATSLFDFLIEVKTQDEHDQTKTEKASKSSKELVAEMRTKLTSLEKEEPSLRLSDDAIANLLAQSTDALLNAQSVLVGVLGEELSKPVRTADLSTVRYEVERKIRLTDSVPPSILQTLITLSRSLSCRD